MAKPFGNGHARLPFFFAGAVHYVLGRVFRALEGNLSMVRPSSFWGLLERP